MKKKEITKSIATSSCLAEELLYSRCEFPPQKLLLDIHDFKILMYTKFIWGKKIRVVNPQVLHDSQLVGCGFFGFCLFGACVCFLICVLFCFFPLNCRSTFGGIESINP